MKLCATQLCSSPTVHYVLECRYTLMTVSVCRLFSRMPVSPTRLLQMYWHTSARISYFFHFGFLAEIPSYIIFLSRFLGIHFRVRSHGTLTSFPSNILASLYHASQTSKGLFCGILLVEHVTPSKYNFLTFFKQASSQYFFHISRKTFGPSRSASPS